MRGLSQAGFGAFICTLTTQISISEAKKFLRETTFFGHKLFAGAVCAKIRDFDTCSDDTLETKLHMLNAVAHRAPGSSNVLRLKSEKVNLFVTFEGCGVVGCSNKGVYLECTRRDE
jgi:hypothetical protein